MDEGRGVGGIHPVHDPLEFLVSEDGEYYSLGAAWQPHCLSVTWSDGDQKDVEAAIYEYLDSESLPAQQGL